MEALRRKINELFAGKEPYEVARNTLAAVLLLYYGSKALKVIQRDGLKKAVFRLLMSAAKAAPGASNLIEAEKKKTLAKLERKLLGEDVKGQPAYLRLPKEGVSRTELLRVLEDWKRLEEARWKKGQVSGGIYHGGEELLSFLVKVYGMFALSNPLHADVFSFVRKMEAEVVSMCVGLFNGKNECCGAMTSGGTESILMAMLAYRNRALAQGIEEPELVVPVTAHAAFDKAASYFRFKIVHVPVDPDTFRVDTKAVRRAINRNTMAIVGSAPHFPQGIIDPIQELSEIALEHKVGLHVDCCLGGFLLPFIAKLGYHVPPFDFRLPGVTSISADTHKYGYAPKGSSVVLFSSHELRHYMYFVAPDWPGGIYATPTMSGSRAGGLVAATWAAMVTIGEKGYLECADAIMKAAKKIEAGVASIRGLRVLGKPDMSVIAFTTDPSTEEGKRLNIYQIADAMSHREWNLNTLQRPASIHICCTYMHRGEVADRFVADLRAAVQEVLADPTRYKSGSAAIYGMAEALPDSSLTVEMAKGYLDVTLMAAPSS